MAVPKFPINNAPASGPKLDGAWVTPQGELSWPC
jgi:hypothetical protein